MGGQIAHHLRAWALELHGEGAVIDGDHRLGEANHSGLFGRGRGVTALRGGFDAQGRVALFRDANQGCGPAGYRMVRQDDAALIEGEQGLDLARF